MAIHVGKHIITLNASPCDYHPRPISVIHAHACQQNVSQDELDGNQVAASSQPWPEATQGQELVMNYDQILT